MQIQVQIQGEMDALLQKMAALSHFRKYAVMKNVAELLRSSTMDRFRSTQAPDGTKWTPSARAERTGGLTLTDTSILKNSIHSIASATGAAVGTNTIYAATHQFGAEDRTIRVSPFPDRERLGDRGESHGKHPGKAVSGNLRGRPEGNPGRV